MNCKKCGAALSENQKFCIKCGTKMIFSEDALSENKGLTPLVNDEEIALDPETSVSKEPLDTDHFPVKSAKPTETQPFTPPKPKNKKSIVPKLMVAILLILILGAAGFMGYRFISVNGLNFFNTTPPESPSYSVNEGTYASAQTVLINTPKGEGLTLYYTMDGSDPDTSDLKYKEGDTLVIQKDTTLRCIAIDAHGNKSPIVVATYKIQGDSSKTTPSALSDNLQENLYGKWKNGKFIFYFAKDGTYQYSDGRDGATGNYAVYQNSPTEGNFSTNSDGKSGISLNGNFSVDCTQRKNGFIQIQGNPFSYVDNTPLF